MQNDLVKPSEFALFQYHPDNALTHYYAVQMPGIAFDPVFDNGTICSELFNDSETPLSTPVLGMAQGIIDIIRSDPKHSYLSIMPASKEKILDESMDDLKMNDYINF